LNECRRRRVEAADIHSMRTSFFRSLLAAAIAALALSSCVVPVEPYAGGYGGGYAGGGYYNPGYNYDYNDFYYYGGGPYPAFYPGYGTYIAGYSYYRGSGVCPICHHRPCSGHSGHSSNWRHSSGGNSVHHDHDDYSGSRGNSNHGSSSTLYQRVPGTPGKADGDHPKSWFLSRGYSPRQLEKVDDHGRGSGKKDGDDDGNKKKSHHDSDDKKKRN
jgi:hypothetical protein